MNSRLPVDIIEQLTPVLGSLARLVSQGSSLSESELELLLTGVAIEGDDIAIAEVSRWGRLLINLHNEPTTMLRRATVEALTLRGLSEAPVLLAVDTVSGGQTSIDSGRSLRVDVAALDFGSLVSYQTGSMDLTVQGGPGQVVVENNQVHVNPSEFGLGTTRIRVTVSPSTSDLLLLSNIKLVTVNETCEIPVIVQWQESTGPVLRVALDGSGDFHDLFEAIKSAHDNTTLHLKSGVYEISHPVRIKRSLILLGEGTGTTTIIGRHSRDLFVFESEGQSVFSDLTVARTRETAGDLIQCRQHATISVLRCRLEEAQEKNNSGGVALRLHDHSQGVVRACAFTNNQYAGLLVRDGAECSVEESHFVSNRHGVVFWGSSTGVIKENTITHNREHGIYVDEQAQPTLEHNTCQQNGIAGIAFSDSAAGIARQNYCCNNRGYEIYIGGRSHPIICSNVCKSRTRVGYNYNPSESPGQVAGREDRQSGIYVRRTARPQLRDNQCRVFQEG